MFNPWNSLWGNASSKTTATVEIYTWQTCPYCIAAKALLFWKGVKFQEYKIDGDMVARNKMAERAHGKRSVPQIFISDTHIGGCTDLFSLEKQGKLNAMLTSWFPVRNMTVICIGWKGRSP